MSHYQRQGDGVQPAQERSPSCGTKVKLRRVQALAAAAALVLAVAGEAAAQTLTFARDDDPSHTGARAIVSADFNRDGWPDVAHANNGRNSVTILLNNAGAGLARFTDVAVGAGPFDLAGGDFNRDGIPDLAVANADGNSISVLSGNGDGTFRRNDVAAVSQNPRGITAADVNNDARLDLIYTAYATGAVQVLIGNGLGGFAKGVSYTSSALRPQGVTTADFNHDGYLDVAVAYASASGLRILYGNGGTALTARAVPGAANLNVVEVGDFNQDGWTDLAAASTARSSLEIYRGSSTGLVHTQSSAVGSSPRGISVGELNDDGLLDLVTANRGSSTVSALLGDPAHPGAFRAPLEVAAGAGSRDVVVTDFDNDARLDAATGNEYAASVTVLSNRTLFQPAAYAFRHVAVDEMVVYPWSDIVSVADFNRDGRPDLATAGDADGESVAILLTGGPSVVLPVPELVRTLTVADLNSDANPDVLVHHLGLDARRVPGRRPRRIQDVYDDHGHRSVCCHWRCEPRRQARSRL